MNSESNTRLQKISYHLFCAYKTAVSTNIYKYRYAEKINFLISSISKTFLLTYLFVFVCLLMGFLVVCFLLYLFLGDTE